MTFEYEDLERPGDVHNDSLVITLNISVCDVKKVVGWSRKFNEHHAQKSFWLNRIEHYPTTYDHMVSEVSLVSRTISVEKHTMFDILNGDLGYNV